MAHNLSCIIRTYNEADFIGALIEKLQVPAALVDGLEIIVVDSGSTDSTPSIAKNLSAKLIEVPKSTFNYSTSLNLGIEASSGDLILIVSAHVLPREDNWLSMMVSDFSNESVAGVYCRQVPWPDADWREIVRLERQFSSSSMCFTQDNSLDKLCFSNAASCIRRSAWQKHSFVVIPAGEDHEWAHWAIENGYKVIYEANASVYHSHKEAARDAARRQITIEKASDLRLCRKRTVFLTLKQACGLFVREMKDMVVSDCCKCKRLRAFMDVLAKVFWYAVDFND